MQDLKAKYEQVANKKKNVENQINVLKEDATVKRYFELCKENDSLDEEQKELYKQIKFNEYSSCNHIWVTTLTTDGSDYFSADSNWIDYEGCVKCGMDKSFLWLSGSIYNTPEWLTLDEKIIRSYMLSHCHNSGIHTGLLCDFELARSIYLKVKEIHPDIDDETAIKYLKVALHNIRDNKVSEERKKSRAKRLLLESDFDKWDGKDVVLIK